MFLFSKNKSLKLKHYKKSFELKVSSKLNNQFADNLFSWTLIQKNL